MGMDDDWDLQAVVRGCCSASPPSTSMAATTTTTSNTDPFAFLSPFLLDEDDDDDHLLDFPDLLATQTAIKELEELCMPFFPKSNLSQPISSPTTTTISTPSTAAHPQPLPPRPSQSQISRSTKRRKNQQKRVVCQVPAEGISSDMWAWRKYGQKPIKGSPYPRGYYRCSSSKGCLARKQVERCRNDPNMFVITYTSEHNHPLPTHRNSLAGSTRQKYTDTNAAPHHHPAAPPQSDGKDNTALTASGLSPTTPTASMEEEDEEMLLHPCKQENDHREEEEEEEEEKMFLDEFRGGPNQLTTEDCFLEELSFSLPTPWFSHNAATAAGGR